MTFQLGLFIYNIKYHLYLVYNNVLFKHNFHFLFIYNLNYLIHSFEYYKFYINILHILLALFLIYTNLNNFIIILKIVFIEVSQSLDTNKYCIY